MFEMTQLEVYKSFQFMTELLLGEVLFAMRLDRRSHFIFRAAPGILLCYVFSFFFPIPTNNAFYISFMFFVMFAFTVVVCKFLFAESWLKIVFCCIAGYTTQHLAYELFNLAQNIMGTNINTPMNFYGDQEYAFFANPLLVIVYFYVFIVTYFFSWFFFGRKIEKDEELQLKNFYIFVFSVIIVAVDIILNAVVVFYIATDGNSLYMIIVGIYNILCCIFALFMMFEVSLRRRLETTLDTVKQLWHQEKEQYAVSKENIELINMKCHDLKHQLRNIGGISSLSPSSVKEIENLISIYDSKVKTGNDALDIILTEKSLLCNKNGIKLSCIVDGERLGFMREEDIYSLFGNLIDNAIEAVLPLEEGKRTIGLRVKAADTLLSVNVHNYYEHDLRFVSGMPETTKAEKEYHGFGLKSVRYICGRYGGDLSINTEGGIFNINILFSLENIKKTAV